MIIVLDTNILISALIKDSTTRKIIFESGWDFYYPEMSFHEIQKHKGLVIEKSGVSTEGYDTLLDCLFKHISMIQESRILPLIKEANFLLRHIDPDDVVFLAAGLCLKDAYIWSDDHHFKKQDKIKVLKTEDVIQKFFSMV